MSRLFLVPTPIGNLEDITLRALKILKSVDLVLAEDTRISGILMKHFGIKTPMRSHHAHNEHRTVKGVIQKLKGGVSMALITDAGTPSISDPGFLLARACINNDIKIECLPGAAAFVPALVNSGLPSGRFIFEGFLPVKKGRQSRLRLLTEESRTLLFYESPHKLVKTLHDFNTYFGPNRPAAVSRELTKIHEETKRGTLKEILDYYTSHPPKGEIVIVVGGKK